MPQTYCLTIRYDTFLFFGSIRDTNMIWLIKFKAAMGASSSVNMDGSDAIYATGVVFADTEKNAKTLLQEYLHSDHITLNINEINAEQFDPENIEGAANEIADIRQCVLGISEKKSVALANAISSEAYDYLESIKGDK